MTQEYEPPLVFGKFVGKKCVKIDVDCFKDYFGVDPNATESEILELLDECIDAFTKYTQKRVKSKFKINDYLINQNANFKGTVVHFEWNKDEMEWMYRFLGSWRWHKESELIHYEPKDL